MFTTNLVESFILLSCHAGADIEVLQPRRREGRCRHQPEYVLRQECHLRPSGVGVRGEAELTEWGEQCATPVSDGEPRRHPAVEHLQVARSIEASECAQGAKAVLCRQNHDLKDIGHLGKTAWVSIGEIEPCRDGS